MSIIELNVWNFYLILKNLDPCKGVQLMWEQMTYILVQSLWNYGLNNYIDDGRNYMLKNKVWRIWAKSLGQKEGRSDSEADRIALIRTMIVLLYIVTNLFIIAGIIRHW